MSYLSTAHLARLTDRTPDALRMSYSRLGHWNGIRPKKLPNGRLLWPRNQIETVLGAAIDAPETTEPNKE